MIDIKHARLGEGVAVWARDDAANDSSKDFTVPAGHVWILESVYAEILATATVGNRVLDVSISDGTNVFFRSKSTAAIAASQRGTILVTNTGGASDTTARTILAGTATANVSLNAYDLPGDMVLPAGSVITVKDTGNVDAAADDMVVVLHYLDCPVL